METKCSLNIICLALKLCKYWWPIVIIIQQCVCLRGWSEVKKYVEFSEMKLKSS